MKSPIKWAGSKGRILPELLKHFPDTCTYYVEPFLGGASVFLGYTGKITKDILLNDLNEDLICTYRTLRERSEEVFDLLKSERFSNTPEHFKTIRELNPNDNVLKAARFLYLNRAAFNGLWRVNRSGQFNVPFGNYKKLSYPWNSLTEAGKRFQNTGMINTSYVDFFQRFLSTLSWEGALVYLDPPYDPLTVTSSFAQYQASGFSQEDQENLASLAKEIVRKGGTVIASNHDTPRIRHLWGGGCEDLFTFHPVSVRRSISAKGESRKEVSEVIMVSKKF